jgi:molybdate transport system substrate-binding protein
LALLLQASLAGADDVLVAVATNFSEVMAHLEVGCEGDTSHDVTVVSGSTGKLYAQITNGAPFDVFLAADQEHPRRLHQAEAAGRPFTYAIGRLVLWSPDADRIGADGAVVLRSGSFRRLAMANPALAPYGVAAQQVLEALGLSARLQDRIVLGENIGQAHAMVATGNAELGFVALSYVLSPRNDMPGSRWDVPEELYSPIRQDGVVLARAAGNAAAAAFIEWMHGDNARGVIRGFGYGVE